MWRLELLRLGLGLCFILSVHVNVAQGKAASMSTPYEQPGYRSGPASLAVDGNTSTFYTSCVHTLGHQDREPDWWQVDLGHNYTVTDITIYHREGGAAHRPFTQRIAGVWIYVDDTLCYKFPDSNDIGSERKEKDDVTCQQPIRGQIVKFTKEGAIHNRYHSYINFCEVQIWVCRPGLYGKECDKKCDANCPQGLCDNYDGLCGNEVQDSPSSAPPSPSPHSPASAPPSPSPHSPASPPPSPSPHSSASPPPSPSPHSSASPPPSPSPHSSASPPCDSPDGNCNRVDVALGKAANMSAPYDLFGTAPSPPSMAVDGDTSSCVHTMGDLDRQSDWWQVDLGRSYTVTNITIYHRDSVYLHNQRIAGVWIYVDDTLCYKFPDSFDIGSERKLKDDITCDQPIRGQIVRFSKDGYTHVSHYSFINFCEIQIWVCRPGFYGQHCQNRCSSQCPQSRCDNYDGTCDVEMEDRTKRPLCETPDGNCDKVNVARGKIADMSTPYEAPGYGSGPASLAVDGNTSTYFTSCVHTLGDLDREPDWWQVDLGHSYTVTDITIYHREGGRKRYPHSQRIAGISVYVDGALCYTFPSSVDISNVSKERDDITCKRPIRGRIVKFSKDGFIHARHFSFINFCEVQIWVCRSGLYGKQCEKQCNSHCQQGTCDNYDGTCDIVCSEGYYGAECSEQCGQCQGQETCDRQTGQCPHGCQPDYRPPECQLPAIKTTTTTPETTTTTPETTTTSTTTTTTTTQSTSRVPSTSSPVESPPIPSTSPTSASPTATRKEDNSMDSHNKSKKKGSSSSSSSSSSNNIPVKSDASRQKNINNNSKRSNKKYTTGDMAGMAVSMVVVGAILGTAALALYCRFFGRRHGLDGMAFSLMETNRPDID